MAEPFESLRSFRVVSSAARAAALAFDETKTPRSFERGVWSSKYFRTSLHAPAIAGINGRNDEGEVLNHWLYFMRGVGGVNNFSLLVDLIDLK